MSHTTTNKNIQQLSIPNDYLPKVMLDIIDNYVPDFVCHYRDGSITTFKDSSLHDFLDVVKIEVYRIFTITENTKFYCSLETIYGCGKVILIGDMSCMFSRAKSFNGDVSSWDTSNVTDMSFMFYCAKSFNGDVSSWDTSNVTNTCSMFYGTESFNGDVSSWDTSNVTDMCCMFDGAESFNGDVSSWDTSNVTDMCCMFYGARSFNGNVSSWDTSNVTNMNRMFYNAISFNGDVSSWDTSNVTDMNGMFYKEKCINILKMSKNPEKEEYQNYTHGLVMYKTGTHNGTICDGCIMSPIIGRRMHHPKEHGGSPTDSTNFCEKCIECGEVDMYLDIKYGDWCDDSY